jgi:D-alanyl-D-alanine carboxypeptidase
MTRKVKITLIIAILAAVIAGGFLLLNKNRAHLKVTHASGLKQETINCTQACHKELQTALNYDRIHNKTQDSENVGEQMSISLPTASGKLQPIMNYYSGYATTIKTLPVGTLDPEQPNKRVDLFAQGSITKSYVAAIILQLEQEHRLSLNDTISQYLGNRYPDWNQITIKQLLNMTSGILNYTNDTLFNASFKQPYHRWTADQMIKLAYNNNQPRTHCKTGGNLCFTPGTNYMYSNTAYLLAGKIIESVTNHTLEYEMQHRLLGPKSKLGKLNNTYYLVNYPESIMRRLVHGYGLLAPNIPHSSDWLTQDFTQLNMYTTAADGGNISNAKDIVLWSRLLLQTNKIMQAHQQQQLKQLICNDRNSSFFGQPVKQIGKSCNQGYGLGILERYNPDYGLLWTYEGENVGYTSVYYLLQQSNIDIAIQRGSAVNANFNQLMTTTVQILNKYKVT